jgi:hypothetical protein
LPNKEEHLNQASRNEKLAQSLAQTEYREWTVTVLFYVAVHYIEAFLAVRHLHCDDHSERSEKIRQIPELRKIAKEYDALRTLSRQARYHALPIQPEDVNIAQQKLDVIRAQINYVLTGKKP